MADSFIQLPSDSTGKKVDTRTEGTNSEHREVHIIGDPATNEGVAVVTNVDPSGEIYGIVVRDPNTTTIAANTNVLNSTLIVNQVSGANWSVSVSGSLSSVVATGPTVADSADDGSAPLQIGGVTRTANPTPTAANDIVKSTFDDVGRQLIRPIQVRDLIATAYVSVTNGTETTLRAAVAGAYLDCVSLIASNNSSAAVSLDIRCTTAGNVIHTLRIPADSSAGWVPQVPWPQDATGNNWTIDGPDETGRTITVSALFSQEV